MPTPLAERATVRVAPAPHARPCPLPPVQAQRPAQAS